MFLFSAKRGAEEWLRGCEPLPREAICQLRDLIERYEQLVASGRTSGSRHDAPQVEGVKKRLRTDVATLCWSDLSEVELSIAKLLDDDEVRATLPSWRRRLREVIGESRFNTYLAGAPAMTETDPEMLRADLEQCIATVYYFYAFYGLSARARHDVSMGLLTSAASMLGVLLVVAIGFFFLLHHTVTIVQYLTATCAAGVVASVISVQRRLQDPSVDADPPYRHIQLHSDRLSVAFFSPLTGAVFAAVSYALLASGLVSGTIIPKFDANLVPAAGKDLILVLLYGFLAGFSERFVPDALNRVSVQATQVQETAVQAIKTTATNGPVKPDGAKRTHAKA